MKIKTVTHTSDFNHKGFLTFDASMKKYGFDYIALSDPDFSWTTGYIPHYKWCKNYSEGYTHMLLTDAFDVVALAPESELYEKYRQTDKALLSAEKACYPIEELASQYPETNSRWKYCNGGQFLFPIPMFIEMFERFPLKDMNAQEWITRRFLFDNKGYILDINCEVFQSVSFEHNDEFAITRDGRLLNRLTGTTPIFAHANGSQKQVDEWITRPLI